MVFSTGNPYGQVHITLIPGTFSHRPYKLLLNFLRFLLIVSPPFFFFLNACSSEQHLFGITKNICAISDIALLWLGPVHPFSFVLQSKTSALLSLFSQREGFGRRLITTVVAPNPRFCFPQFQLP